ncbi:MAG: SUMF1/EgtB/PvdO family nonheme iron enzyme, partial [Anaerolineae bacterium]|nr:SUMF1/EgtB/PvdO family nonheme iron enzyme [Anaerolineae bacterium]
MKNLKHWPFKIGVVITLLIASLFPLSRFLAQDSTPEATPTLAAGTVVTDAYGFDMVYVPAGTVEMGISRQQLTDFIQQGALGDDAKSQIDSYLNTAQEEAVLDTVNVTLPAYWIDRYEVTIEQYQARAQDCLSSGRCSKIDLSYAPYLQVDKKQPQVNVDWFDAIRYCMTRSARLPTESEWEYAASGPQNLLFPWGNTLVLENLAMDKTSYNVGTRPNNISWVGAYDLAGNSEEWVEDRMKPYTDAASPLFYVQHQSDAQRVIRGGSYRTSIFQMTTFGRNSDDPDSQDEMGFR